MKAKTQLLVQSIIALIIGFLLSNISYWSGLIMGTAIGIMVVMAALEHSSNSKD